MLIANRQTRNPPVGHIRVIAVSHMHTLPAPLRTIVAVVENLEPVEIMKVPLQAHIFAIDFKGVERLMAPGITGAFKQPQRAILEMA